MTHDRKVLLAALGAGLPAVALALLLLWLGDFSSRTQWTLGLFALGVWFFGALAVRERVIRPLQTLANLVAALGEEDYSIRARGAKPEDPLGLAYWEVNVLADALRMRRLQSVEASALLSRVIAEIDAAIFTFDESRRLRLVNRAGEALLGGSERRVLGRPAAELGLEEFLEGETQRVADAVFPGQSGRWKIRRSTFRAGGRPHDLLVINDLSAVLREEERQAWRRLVRVLSHEINNSLAPIKSIAESLSETIDRLEVDGADGDFRTGLGVIASRSEALRRFMASYARLARLPAPTKRTVKIEDLVRRVVSLETRRHVDVMPGPHVSVEADPDQLEQLLINLIGNAVDAARETSGNVVVTWVASGGSVEIRVDDEGPGLPDATNLFVPFFTTKPNGSGIGLVLSRQIAEAHGGTVRVENRRDRSGCTARLRLPR